MRRRRSLPGPSPQRQGEPVRVGKGPRYLIAGNLCTRKRFSRKVVTSIGANLSGSKIDPFEHFATGCVAVCETAARRSADDGAGRDIRARDG